MMKRLLLLFTCCTQYTETLYSQWTKEDSIWLQDVLSGKEELRLNPEVLKEIELGTWLNTNPEKPLYKEESGSSTLRSLISKDFSEYIKPLEEEKETNPLSIPSAVFIRQGLTNPLPDHKISKILFRTPESVKENAVRPSGMSFGDALNLLFMPSERAKARNRKNANAWKTYQASSIMRWFFVDSPGLSLR
jgi:hypothetical protein